MQVATVPDVQYACVHPAPRTCRPCHATSDCESALSSKPMTCVGFEGTYWCVSTCTGDDCPSGTTCQDVAVGRASQKM